MSEFGNNKTQCDALLRAALVIGDMALALKGSSEDTETDAEIEDEFYRLWALREEVLKLRGR